MLTVYLCLQFFWEMQPWLILQYYVYTFCDYTQNILKLHYVTSSVLRKTIGLVVCFKAPVETCTQHILSKRNYASIKTFLLQSVIPGILNNLWSMNVGHIMFVLAYDVGQQ